MIMHSQVLVIYPPDADLKDVMYPYQEVDKYDKDKMTDDRCDFILTVEEEAIPDLLVKIKEYIEDSVKKDLEILQYRTSHSYEETKEKYGYNALRHTWDIYKYSYRELKNIDEIINLPFDDPRQIQLIQDNGYSIIDKPADLYIKGVGYGYFINPYQMWDYYQQVKERGFPKEFLLDAAGNQYVQMYLRDLDVTKTILNIKELSMVWEYIIFCEKDPKNSRVYTNDDVRFGEDYNKHCLVDNIFNIESLEDVLMKLSKKYCDGDYIVTALDFHW